MSSSSPENILLPVLSEFWLLDLFLWKKHHKCSVAIPDTILLQKGFLKEWLFNSRSEATRPILKKKKQHLFPLTVLKIFLSKRITLPNAETVNELCRLAEPLIPQDSRQHHLIIKTASEMTRITLQDWLGVIASTQSNDQALSSKWHIIMDMGSCFKIFQTYHVQTVRINGALEHWTQKKVTVPSDNGTVTESYKFRDSQLNKIFYNAVGDVAVALERNYRVQLQSMETVFCLNKDREPFLVMMNSLHVRLNKRISETLEAARLITKGYVKVDDLAKFAETFETSHPQFNYLKRTEQKQKCCGGYCRISLVNTQEIGESQTRLSSLNPKRALPSYVVQAVKKKASRVLQRMKDLNLITQVPQDSEVDSDELVVDEKSSQPLEYRVCQTCFKFYLLALKLFNIDQNGGLTDRKQAATPKLTTEPSSPSPKKINPAEDSPKKLPLPITFNRNKISEPTEKPRVLSQAKQKKTQLAPINHEKMIRSASNDVFQKKDNQPERTTLHSKSKIKLDSIAKPTISSSKHLPLTSNVPPQKAIILAQLSKGPVLGIRKEPRTVERPKSAMTQFYQAAEKLAQNFTSLDFANSDEFVSAAMLHCRLQAKEFIDRFSFSSSHVSGIYEFMTTSPITLPKQYKIRRRPELSLKKLSELTGYPEIVSRSSFIFDTLICDQKTTVPFCVISTAMIHGDDNPDQPYLNVVFVNDIFDSFIELVSTMKEVLEQQKNTRILLFNYPGQSHTIYDSKNPMTTNSFNGIMDKLLFHLNTLSISFNCSSEQIKFVGSGLGGYLIIDYLTKNDDIFGDRLRGLLLLNSFQQMPQTYRHMAQQLRVKFSTVGTVMEKLAYSLFAKAVESSENSEEDLQRKASLNPIRVAGRIYLLDFVCNEANEDPSFPFEDLFKVPVQIVYGVKNKVVSLSSSRRISQFRKNPGQAIPNRDFQQVLAGHDLIADNYDEYERTIIEFIRK